MNLPEAIHALNTALHCHTPSAGIYVHNVNADCLRTVLAAFTEHPQHLAPVEDMVAREFAAAVVKHLTGTVCAQALAMDQLPAVRMAVLFDRLKTETALRQRSLKEHYAPMPHPGFEATVDIDPDNVERFIAYLRDVWNDDPAGAPDDTLAKLDDGTIADLRRLHDWLVDLYRRREATQLGTQAKGHCATVVQVLDACTG